MTKKILKISIISILVLIVFFILINPKKITKKLPIKTRLSIENAYFEYYGKLNDSIKIILRTAGLDPFEDIHKRYNRKAPKAENLNNDYNVKFLPNTQYGKIEFLEKKINFDLNLEKYSYYGKYSLNGFFQSFFIESYKDKVLIINNKIILYADLKEVIDKNKTKVKYNIVSTNLIDLANSGRVLGTLIHKNKLYVSYFKRKDKCEYFKIVVSDLNLKNLEFKKFYSSNECG